MTSHTTVCAGIDTPKHKLDVAIAGQSDELQVDNTPDGHARLSAWLVQHRVVRHRVGSVGIEPSGGYEAAVVAALRLDGFVVAMLQPGQVRAFARFRLQRAKNDRIDAALIASCTSGLETIHAPPDPRLTALARYLTLRSARTSHGSRTAASRAATAMPGVIGRPRSPASRRLCKAELADLTSAIQQHRDLARRLALVASVPGMGQDGHRHRAAHARARPRQP